MLFPETLLTFRITTPVKVDMTKATAAFRFVGPDDFEQPVQAGGVQMQRRPQYSPSYGSPYGGSPYGSPYPYGGVVYGPGYYPAPYYSGFWGPSFGFGVVVRGGGFGGYRRWR